MATLVQRKFGTDLSNVNQDAMAKRLAGKAKAVSTQSVHITPAFAAPANETISLKTAPIETQIDEEFEKLASQTDIASLPIASPQQTDISKAIYGIQFLLQFQKICSEPVEFLVPEIAKDKYVAPKFTPVMNRTGSRPSTPSSGSAKKTYSYREKSPFAKTPGGGVVFVPVQKKTESPAAELFLQHLNTNSAFADVHSPIVQAKPEPEVINLEIVPQTLKFEEVDIASPAKVAEPAQAVESPTSVKNVQLEWRPKSAKKEKPRETDEKRLSARQKQIDIGKATTGYKNFIAQVPKNQRTKEHPRTPNKNQVCSKRSWDGQVRKWRRMLHFYDPEIKTEDSEAQEKDEEEIVASDSEDSDIEEDSIIPTDLAAAMASVKPRSIVMNLEKVLAEETVTL